MKVECKQSNKVASDVGFVVMFYLIPLCFFSQIAAEICTWVPNVLKEVCKYRELLMRGWSIS